jgi:predicted DCC family thiol-disulfide oxidoreductase YuxK
LRGVVYRLIARNRYRWFGRHDVCDLGGVAMTGRVLTELPAALDV